MKAIEEKEESQLGGQMSFLEHLDELRKRLVWSVLFVGMAFIICWFFSANIYNFLAIPVESAIAEAQQRQLSVSGKTGEEKIQPLSNLKEGDSGLYVFNRETNFGLTTVAKGVSVKSKVEKDTEGNLGLYTNEPIITENAIIPEGVKIPIDFAIKTTENVDPQGRMIVTTATEPFMLYVTVSLYAAIALSVPFLLLQIWGFISPALYQHERNYVTPFIFLSSISFVLGAAFAYYIIFPPAVIYLLGMGKDFNLMLKATEYFDFITLMMLAMGIIFQMPAISYVLSRIGIINAQLLIKSWKIAIVVIMIVAAVVSPTGDVLNLMIFASPMMILYLVSIFIAWLFGKERKTEV